MLTGTPDPHEVGRLFALAQVGLEMVAPIALGVWLDARYDWRPWATATGAVLGLVGGLVHLVVLQRRFDNPGPTPPRQEPP